MTPISKARAQCASSARWDLCGGPALTGRFLPRSTLPLVFRRLVSLPAAGITFVAFVALLLSATPALASRAHEFSKAIKPGGAYALKEPAGVAVNESSGEVYVVDRGNNRVEYFSSEGMFEGQFNGSGAPTGQFSQPEAIAVDNACRLHNPVLTEATVPSCSEFDPSNGDVYVVDVGHKVMDKFSASGTYIGQIKEAGTAMFGSLGSVALDPRGELWICESAGVSHVRVDSFSNAETNAFLSFKEVTVSGSSPSPLCAVYSQDDLYIGNGGPISKFNSAGQISVPPVDEESSSGIAIDFSTDDVYIDNLSRIARFASNGALIEGLDVPGMHGTGVAVNSATGTAYGADSSTDVVDVYVLEEEKTEEKEVEKGKEWFNEFAEENARKVAEEAAVRMRHEEEATAAAARKHREEEAAASHKREEEAAPKKKKEEALATGGIALADTTVTVQGGGVALVKLECLGGASCHGKLALSVSAKIAATAKAKGKKRWARTVRIGTAVFSIAGDEAKTVKVNIDAAGRALLSTDRGRLSASLEILELAPRAETTQTKTVRLVREKADKGRQHSSNLSHPA